MDRDAAVASGRETAPRVARWACRWHPPVSMVRPVTRFVLPPLLLALFSGAPAAKAEFGFAVAPASLAPLVGKVAPSVVGIAVTEATEGTETHGNAAAGGGAQGRTPAAGEQSGPPSLPPAPAQAPDQAAGSGFIVSRAGFIVTNDHVIAGASRIVVTLNNGQRYDAKLVGADPLTDIAVIKISSSKGLLPAHWGDSAHCRVGDWVLAAGNPFALGNSFTLGIISAEGRDIGEGPFDHFLQLDAPINPGNSGGPAFNMQGEVIGINSAIVSPSGGSVGIGFAIPSNSARPVVAALIAHGEVPRGWLGVTVEDLPARLAGQAGGAEITGVEPASPADRFMTPPR
ncbi:MAG: endopeptidase [Rhodospirillales bacterium 20-64-7]|nr:MAG: endopeptidase [Rhodospirillales bacterium 20-64-7]